jgi:hypothetical protein
MCGDTSGVAWISSNEEVSVGVLDPYGDRVSKRLRSEPPIALTLGAPRTVPASQFPLGSQSQEGTPIAPDQRNIHSTSISRHFLATWPIASRLRKSGLYLLTSGTSRERASEAAAVIGLEWMRWASRKWCGAEDKADEARMDVSKEELPGA